MERSQQSLCSLAVFARHNKILPVPYFSPAQLPPVHIYYYNFHLLSICNVKIFFIFLLADNLYFFIQLYRFLLKSIDRNRSIRDFVTINCPPDYPRDNLCTEKDGETLSFPAFRAPPILFCQRASERSSSSFFRSARSASSGSEIPSVAFSMGQRSVPARLMMRSASAPKRTGMPCASKRESPPFPSTVT